MIAARTEFPTSTADPVSERYRERVVSAAIASTSARRTHALATASQPLHGGEPAEYPQQARQNREDAQQPDEQAEAGVDEPGEPVAEQL